jgi:hypothetical protein
MIIVHRNSPEPPPGVQYLQLVTLGSQAIASVRPQKSCLYWATAKNSSKANTTKCKIPWLLFAPPTSRHRRSS